MKKSILYFSSTFLLLLGLQEISFAQNLAVVENNYAIEETTSGTNTTRAMLLQVPDSNYSKPLDQRRSLTTGLRLMAFKVTSGHLPIGFEDIIRGKITSLSPMLDYSYTLPYTKIRVDLSIDNYGRVVNPVIDGNKLDEHLIKDLEDTLK